MHTPAGTPVSGSTNTFDYPILSNVTLICAVTPNDTFTVINYKWDTTGCFTSNRQNTPTCFPTGQTKRSVIGYNLFAEDAGSVTCTATIDGINYVSKPLTLRIKGK